MEIEIMDAVQPLYVSCKIPIEIMENLRQKIFNTLNNKETPVNMKERLVGNIEKQYAFNDCGTILCPILSKMANAYYKKYDEKKYNKNLKWRFDDIWVNFQKKYEYNPIHDHAGVMSFVLWIQIPYELKEELSLSNSKNSNCPRNSIFEFFYTSIDGRITSCPIYVDKTYEGTIIVFPSYLNHTVYPFYTNPEEYRISISGNIAPDFEFNKEKFSYQ